MSPTDPATARKEHVPDLSPWGPEIGERVQPVFSALFHDLMTPLSVLDSNLFLARKYLEKLLDEGDLDEEARTRIASVLEFIDIGRTAGKRVLEGLRIPRNAIWQSVLDGTPFDVRAIVEQISEATKAPRHS